MVGAAGHQVFISHIHEEAALGRVIKEWVEDAFAAHAVTAFLSSDQWDAPAGRKWIDVIQGALHGARVMICLISPNSLPRPWIHIELGAGWIKGLHVVPLCHSGQSFGHLPRPFQDFNGVDLDSKDCGERLLGGVADGLQVSAPRRLHFEQMRAQLIDAANSVAKPASRTVAPTGALLHLEQEELNVLKFLAEKRERGSDSLLLDYIAGALRLRKSAVEVLLNRLESHALVARSLSLSGPTMYFITAAGLERLVRGGSL
jgi:DNA-binding MarR family transcriptional regulator